MSNFLKFIAEDIDAKKTLISTLPTKTKKNVKLFNEKIASIHEKYDHYRARVKKYVVTKSKTFNIKRANKEVDQLREKVGNLEHVRFVLNPLNTFFEKMGFDNLLYEIRHYYDFNFNSLNDIINKFLDKFEMAGIKLFSGDFDYTCYVHEYMTAFLETRDDENNNYEEVSEVFEKIYWVNPEIISHIELNFRKLIKKHEKKLNHYVAKLQKEVMSKNEINSFEDCLTKLKATYIELNKSDKEDITDIIDLAKNGEIDINNYFEDSKVRKATYTNMVIDPLNLEDKSIMDRFYDSLHKLKANIKEYINYIKFKPLISDFRDEFKKQVGTDAKSVESFRLYEVENTKALKTIESQISSKESKLEKMNKDLSIGKIGFFEAKKNKALKQLRLDSIKQAKELYDLYKKYDEEYFKEKVLSILSGSLTLSELLHFYYSFDYFKKFSIKRVFNITSYDEILKYSEEFDLFAMDPTNIVIKGVNVFEENDVAKVIMNKYRLDNINLTEENLTTGELELLLEKIQLLLRINEIESSSTTVEKIWFMAQVEKILSKETKKE